MRTVIGQAILALVLAAAGGVCWTLGQAERRLAGLHTELATMQYGVAADRAGEIEPTLGYAALPGFGNTMLADAQTDRATADYWLGRYDRLSAGREGTGAGPGRPAGQALLASNGAYRSAQVETVDRATALQHLEGVINGYAEVLRADPGNVDAAYNYEFVARNRNALARSAGSTAKLSIAETTPTIHGRPGAPPKGVSMSSFRVLVPQRSEERKAGQDAGKGGAKPRKG